MGGLHIIILSCTLAGQFIGFSASSSSSSSESHSLRKHRHRHHHDHVSPVSVVSPLSDALSVRRDQLDQFSHTFDDEEGFDIDASFRQPDSHHAKHAHGTDKHTHGAESQARLDKLIADKLNDYQKLARPIPDCSTFDCTHRIKVFMGLSFRKLVELNQAEGSLKLNVWLRLTWPDYRLRYNATEYFGDVPMFGEGDNFNWDSEVDSIPIAQHAVWTPDVQLVNSIKEPEDINTAPRVFWFDERKLHDKGYNMMLVVPQIIDVNCPVSLEKFPFDIQTCQLEFGDWSASEQYFEFDTIDRGATQMAMAEKNQDFSFENVSVSREKKAYSALETTRFPEIVYTLTLRRYPHYYLLHFVLPQLLLVLLGQGIYWMSIEAERLSTGVTVILAVMTVSFLTAPMLPETNEVMWLERFQVGCYILTCAPVFVSMLLDHAKHMELSGEIWFDHADNFTRVTHPLFVLVFYIYMFHDITWPKDQLEVQGFLLFNVVVYFVFALAGILSFCQYLGRLRRDTNKLSFNDAALAYKHKADEDLDEPEPQDEVGRGRTSTGSVMWPGAMTPPSPSAAQAPNPQVNIAELRDAIEALRRSLDGGAGSEGSPRTLALRNQQI